MKFEEFLKIVSPRIGPNNAFDLSRDARLKAFEAILMEKTGATRAEVDAEVEKQLGDIAQGIVRMPPIPSDEKSDDFTSDSDKTKSN